MSNLASRLPPVGGYNHKIPSHTAAVTEASNLSSRATVPLGGHITTEGKCSESNNNCNHTENTAQIAGSVQQLSISAGDFQVHCGYNNNNTEVDDMPQNQDSRWVHHPVGNLKVIGNMDGSKMTDNVHLLNRIDNGNRMLKHSSSTPNIPANSSNQNSRQNSQTSATRVGGVANYRNPSTSQVSQSSSNHGNTVIDSSVSSSASKITKSQMIRNSQSFSGQIGWEDDEKRIHGNHADKMAEEYHHGGHNNSKMGSNGIGQHRGQDSYSSGYSGMSESHSSGSPYNTRDPDSQSIHSGYLNDYSEVGSCIRRVIRQKVLPAAAAEVEMSTDNETTFSTFTQSTLLATDDYVYLEKCPKLVQDLGRDVPWNENEVLYVLREGRTAHMSGHITVEMMQRIAFLLQRPLLRITQEAQRLSLRLNMCTKHEIETAVKLSLSRPIAQSCQQACAKALTLYTMSGDGQKQSKSGRSGLKFSVGRFHRWLVLAGVGLRVHEFSAICLAACMENLLEEIVLRALAKEKLGK